MTSQQHTRSLKVTDVNPHLLCVLCGGYYIDATTIIECLHSFCKSCIVRYLETNKYCPICDVQVHKSKPLLNIRPDRNLQAIVYKLVPGLYLRELQSRKEFYKQCFNATQVNIGNDAELPGDSPVFMPDELIRLKVQYENTSTTKVNDKRHFNCPAAVTVYHLQKLMRNKFNLNSSEKVDFLYDGDLLPDYLSLMDLAYMYHWKRKYPVELEYRFLGYQKKKIKLSHDENHSDLGKDKNIIDCKKDSSESERGADQPDREVQLQISENGVISVQSVSMNVTETDNVVCPRLDDNKSSADVAMPVKDIHPETIELMKSLEKTVNLDFEQSLSKDNEISNFPSNNNQVVKLSPTKPSDPEEANKGKTNNVAFEKNAREEVNIKNSHKPEINQTNLINKPEPAVSPGIVLNTSIHVQKVYPGAVKEGSNYLKSCKGKETRTEKKEQDKNCKSSTEKEYTKPPNNVRYKTLKTTVKPWNPSIPRSSIMAMKQAQLANQEKSESSEKSVSKTPKFFKMRNLPRFLGNPASGVKPMYQVLPGSELSNQMPQTSTSQNTKQNSEMTVMKIDPKTLSPIPVSSSARSKMTSSSNRLMTSLSKPTESSIFRNRSPLHSPISKSSNSYMKSPSQTHPPRLPTSPFLLPPHSPHMLYSGFPRPFSPIDTTQSRLRSENQIFRAMSMLCSPSGAFHPSLPPSISMLFNPHHPHHRSSQNEKMNIKYSSSDFHKSASSTPSVQRIPPSCPPSKHCLSTPYSSSSESNHSKSSSQDNSTAKPYVNEKHTKEKHASKTTNISSEEKSEIVGHDSVQKRLSDISSAPLSNGFATDLYKCTVDTNICDKNKEDNNDKMVQKIDATNEHVNKDIPEKSSVNKSSVIL